MEKHLGIVKNLVDYIEQNIAEKLDVITLAESSGLSPWHFQRLFKSLVGDSLGGYLKGRRLTLAADFLLKSKLRIIDVAVEVGFNSNEVFSRAFKSQFQMTPKEFREEKPKVVLAQKPLLTSELLTHITEDVRVKPKFISLDERTVIGLSVSLPSPFLSGDDICEVVYTPWMELFKRQEEIQSRIKHTYYGLTLSPSGTYTEENLNYLAGVPTSDPGPIPEGMVSTRLPEQEVAVFEVQSKLDGEALKRTVDYIYGYWLPNSRFERGEGVDFELFEGVVDYTDPNFSTQYVIPIIPK
ncbi:MAG: AraC family transcriptional regulator [Proteobacteria bacterium]|nr:AraC family transcriptional regulator [Pseudomonadota bacterium]